MGKHRTEKKGQDEGKKRASGQLSQNEGTRCRFLVKEKNSERVHKEGHLVQGGNRVRRSPRFQKKSYIQQTRCTEKGGGRGARGNVEKHLLYSNKKSERSLRGKGREDRKHQVTRSSALRWNHKKEKKGGIGRPHQRDAEQNRSRL